MAVSVATSVAASVAFSAETAAAVASVAVSVTAAVFVACCATPSFIATRADESAPDLGASADGTLISCVVAFSANEAGGVLSTARTCVSNTSFAA